MTALAWQTKPYSSKWTSPYAAVHQLGGRLSNRPDKPKAHPTEMSWRQQYLKRTCETHNYDEDQALVEGLYPEDGRDEQDSDRGERLWVSLAGPAAVWRADLEHLDKGYTQSVRSKVYTSRPSKGTYVKYAVLLKMSDPENRIPIGKIERR
jgi:hypothetical protein